MGKEARKGLWDEKAELFRVNVQARTHQFKDLVDSLFEIIVSIKDADHARQCLQLRERARDTEILKELPSDFERETPSKQLVE